MELKAALERWDSWLASQSPSTHALLAPGVEVADAIPELATLWAWHAGQQPEPPRTAKGKPVLRPVFASGYTMWSVLSPSEAAVFKTKLDERLARGGFDTETYTTKHAWHPRWYPFALGGNKTTIMVVDLEGCFSGGTAGQLIAVDTLRALERELHAPSLLALVELQLAMADAGGLAVDAKKGLLKLVEKRWTGLAGYPKRKNLDKTPRVAPRASRDKLLDIIKERMSKAEVEAAIAAGAALDVMANGLAPIHLAAQCPTTGALEALLAAGVPVEMPDAAGRTALAIAVEVGRPRDAIELIKVLRAHGASPDAADFQGQTPRTRARGRYDAATAGAQVLTALDQDHQ